MKDNDQTAAEKFSREIDGLLAGSRRTTEGAPTEETARQMVALARKAVPEAGFAAALEKRLLKEAGQRSRAARPAVARRWVYAGAAFATVATVVLLAVVLLGGRTPLPGSGVAGGVETPTAPVQTVETVTPAVPRERPMLPSLAELADLGVGGQGGTVPEDLMLVLEAALPEGPQVLMVYSLLEQGPLTVETAQRLAAKFGLAGGVYMPLWMVDAGAVAEIGHNAYFVVDGAQLVMVEGTESWTYTDRQGSLFYQGHFRQPVGLPQAAEAEAIARGFLEQFGLLLPMSGVHLSGNTVSFYAITDGGYEVSEPYARVLLGDYGRVESVEYRPYPVQELGQYTLRSAEEAYTLITSRSASAELWYAGAYDPLPWGAFTGMDSQYWARQRAADQWADLYGEPLVLLPTAEGQEAYVQLQGLELRGLQAEIADFVIGMAGPVHVWGTIEQADGYQILRVEGWESGQAMVVSGLIRTLGGEGRLEGHDGQVYILPDLPADLAEGAEVFVQGGLVGSVLDWDLIQAMPEPSEPGCQACGAPVGVGTIEAVELIYYAPPVGYAPAEARPGVDYGAIQPVWRFFGRDERGMGFTIYVQAVIGVGE